MRRPLAHYLELGDRLSTVISGFPAISRLVPSILKYSLLLCVQVLVVNPVFFKYVNDLWTEHHGRYPSTGMLAIIFALHICDQVRESGAPVVPSTLDIYQQRVLFAILGFTAKTQVKNLVPLLNRNMSRFYGPLLCVY